MNKSFFKKLLSVLLSAAVLLLAAPLAASAAETDYTIVNPYAAVDWSTTGQYKANLHTHSIVSDGGEDFDTMVEKHYELGYDILAMTDHGTVDRGWVNLNINPFLTFAMNIGTSGAHPEGLTQQRFDEISAGTDRGGRGMLRAPFGIEHNTASFNNTHVNSLFCDYGDGYLGGTSYYDHILAGVQAAGGISFINHPSMYTGAQDDTPDAAYSQTDPHYRYIVRKFTNLYKNYPSCAGLEILNADDNRTKNDRKLWDILLGNVIPAGRNIFGFGNSDAHSLSGIDNSWNIMCMPANTEENLRTCMEQGAFFACSRYVKNPAQLAQLEAETGLALGTAWAAEAGAPQPKVTAIAVDEAADTVTLTTENSRSVHWVADGKVICVGNTIDLDEHAAELGNYVRAEVWGEGGILYTQPFILEYAGAPVAEEDPFFDFGIILHYIEQAFYNLVKASRLLSWLQEMALGA